VNLDSFSSTYPGLRLLVKHLIHEAVNIEAQNQDVNGSVRPILDAIHRAQPQIITTREIPVKLDVNSTQISYVSAIALFLEKSWNQPATEIAQKLTAALVQTAKSNNFEAQFPSFQLVWKSFSFEANSAGWITLKLADQGLAKWLEILIYLFQDLKNLPQDLRNLPNETNNGETNPPIYLRSSTDLPYSISRITHDKYIPRNSTDILLAQHVHARCCSLLRLGMQEDLIQLSVFSRGQSIVDPLPWLREDASLRCQHPSERQLMRQICQSVDEISLVSNFSEPERTLKQARGLSQAFCRFYADCLIFSEVKVTNPALSQVRLGLIDVVRSLLHLLLEDGLGILAPSEL
jgi:arginyl-tRNA synthetase